MSASLALDGGALAVAPTAAVRHVWTRAEVEALFALPFADLMYRAQQVHRANFDANAVQRSTLLSIKTGGCSEDCGYCSQSARYATGLEREALLPVDEVLAAARAAKDKGATRFCMGAAWRGPKQKDLEPVKEMIRAVKSLGMETCTTLGMLQPGQAEELKDAGLDYYNHNLDTSPEHYVKIISTHTQADRFDTLDKVRAAGIKVCSGGIIGMGETRRGRADLLCELANMNPPPDSVPINNLVPIPGTPLAAAEPIDPFDFVRTIACARILMPASYVRLSAGRQQMSDELQALCFLAGANSIFYGDKLLTADNPEASRDEALFERLGLQAI
ncbi:biotin synthase [Sterolibacterium denitrificans]|uniref:Biotin synthase n=1 Tax=Sterolibacterium denitrificans TaxID=157592 RepID=A0A7Z7HQQ8_9PROT|nr:biotin synthase BioB [Sterolibacterium denitrificans]SMB24927.1 biotin synthase [Sterolibacterium denitrificans]